MMKFLRSLMPSRQTGRILLTGFLSLQLVFGYVGQVSVVSAQIIAPPINTNTPSTTTTIPTYTGRGVEESIKQYLCAPDPANIGTDLFVCISKLYRFGIAFGAIALVFFVVYAGYVYITGGEASKGKGKSIVYSAITGMAIILSSYVLLSFINPDLVKIKPIQPPIFTATNLPKCEEVSLGVNCILPSGQVQVGSNGGVVVKSGEMIQGNGVSCSLGDDKLANQKASCTNANKYKNAIDAASSKYGVDKALIKAIIQKESGWKEQIVSWTGCCHGLMQVKLETGRDELGCESGWQTDGAKNIDCGTKYLAKLSKNSSVNSSAKYIISAYNAGPGKKSQGPSPICSGLRVWECPFTNASKNVCSTNVNGYAQTRDYVVTVSRFVNEFKSCSN